MIRRLWGSGGRSTRVKNVRGATLLAVFAATFVGPIAAPASADATFSVNSVADVVDSNPGDGICDTGNTVGDPAGPECTLRAAVQETNALAGTDTISLPAGQFVLTLEGSEDDVTPDAAIGDLDLTDDVTIDGASPSTTVVRPANSATGGGTIARGFEVWNASTAATVSDLEILNGDARREALDVGGGFRNNGATVTLERVRVTDGGACEGGGLANHNGAVTITDSTFRLNDAFEAAGNTCSMMRGAALYSDGGSIVVDTSILSENDATEDGAVLFMSAGTADFTDSTMDSNSALESGGAMAIEGGTLSVGSSTLVDNIAEFDGGAIYQTAGQVNVSNSTLSNNSAGTSSTTGSGGALYTTASASLANVTAAFNGATDTVGGIATAGGGIATLRNTILAGSSGEGSSSAECNAVSSEGGNLIEDVTGCAITGSVSTYIEDDPMLDSLSNNGGPTSTHAPDSTSPAIDGGDNSLCFAVDQRGSARPDDGPDADTTETCDIGAYEWFDSDNDGVEDIDEPNFGTGSDDPDTDDDGMLDGDEISQGYDPRDPCDPSSDNEACAASVDTDEDGIIDRFDNCDGQPEDYDGFQDLDGCPDPDNDGDGINDTADQCDGEPEDFDGWQDDNGCPEPDNDSDGNPDENDTCPNQSEDFDGFQDSDGCPDPDNDGDGVLDGDDPDPDDQCVPDDTGTACDPDDDGITNNTDQCDNEAEDVDGFQDADGCPDPDNDGDGVLDGDDPQPNNTCVPSSAGPTCDPDSDGIVNSADSCDNEAEDVDGFQDSDGCPDPDNDGDGVPDTTDECDNEAEDVDDFQDADGCPDPDNDGDGVLDGSDPEPNNTCVPSSSGSTCDPDSDGMANSTDSCDNEAEDIDGFQDTDGCPDPDNDGDGVSDTTDECDNEAEDLDGFEDLDGCPEQGPDGDGDGVDDGFDDCEGPQEDEDGFQDSDGCPDPDNDGDGVLDGSDPAPNDPCVPDDSGAGCDSDGDSVLNGGDNCVDVPNADQKDKDGDSVGDLCEAMHKRSVANFSVKKHVVASGKLTVGDSASACVKQAPIALQLKKKKRGKLVWVTVTKGKTSNTGAFSLKYKDVKGLYRVVASSKKVTYASTSSKCGTATSKSLKHKH